MSRFIITKALGGSRQFEIKSRKKKKPTTKAPAKTKTNITKRKITLKDGRTRTISSSRSRTKEVKKGTAARVGPQKKARHSTPAGHRIGCGALVDLTTKKSQNVENPVRLQIVREGSGRSVLTSRVKRVSNKIIGKSYASEEEDDGEEEEDEEETRTPRGGRSSTKSISTSNLASRKRIMIPEPSKSKRIVAPKVPNSYPTSSFKLKSISTSELPSKARKKQISPPEKQKQREEAVVAASEPNPVLPLNQKNVARTAVVGGLSISVDEKRLIMNVLQCGGLVEYAQIDRDDDGNSLGTAEVTFTNASDARAIATSHNGKIVNGTRLQIFVVPCLTLRRTPPDGEIGSTHKKQQQQQQQQPSPPKVTSLQSPDGRTRSRREDKLQTAPSTHRRRRRARSAHSLSPSPHRRAQLHVISSRSRSPIVRSSRRRSPDSRSPSISQSLSPSPKRAERPQKHHVEEPFSSQSRSPSPVRSHSSPERRSTHQERRTGTRSTRVEREKVQHKQRQHGERSPEVVEIQQRKQQHREREPKRERVYVRPYEGEREPTRRKRPRDHSSDHGGGVYRSANKKHQRVFKRRSEETVQVSFTR